MHKPELLALRYELEALCIDFWHEVDINGGGRAAGYYVDDAVFESSVREYRGRAEIEAFYGRRSDRTARVSLHVVNNFRVEQDDEERLRCQYILLLYAANGVPVLPSRPPIMLALVEETVLRQADGSWRYASRRVQPQFRDDTPTAG